MKILTYISFVIGLKIIEKAIEPLRIPIPENAEVSAIDVTVTERYKNTLHTTPTLFRSSEGRIHSTFFGHPVEYLTEGYFPCTGVKIPSQVDFYLAMTS